MASFVKPIDTQKRGQDMSSARRPIPVVWLVLASTELVLGSTKLVVS